MGGHPLEVTPGRGRKETVLDRVEQHVRRLAETGELVGSLRVPNAVAPITIVANLRSRQLTTSVQLAAPSEGRQPTRVKWLLRQLPEGDPRLRLNAFYANARETGSALLGEVKEQPQRLLSPSDTKREIKGFEVALTRVLGQKNWRGAGSFIEETRESVARLLRRGRPEPDAVGGQGSSVFRDRRGGDPCSRG
jgi:hypothetical protein